MFDLLDWLKASADETRLRILIVCSQGEFSVSELTFILGQSQPRVSRHLKVLCDAGLLTRHREQTWVFYGINSQMIAKEYVSMLVLLSSKSEQSLMSLDQERVAEVQSHRGDRARQILHQYLQDNGAMVLDEGEEKAFASLIQSALEDHKVGNLLDIGTGTGMMLRLLGEQAEEAIGIDISADMLMLARSNLQKQGLSHCMVRHGDMYQLPYTQSSFQTITMDKVLSYAEHPQRAVNEAYRLLDKQGRLLIIEYFPVDAAMEQSSEQTRDWLSTAGFADSSHHALDVSRVRVKMTLGIKNSA